METKEEVIVTTLSGERVFSFPTLPGKNEVEKTAKKAFRHLLTIWEEQGWDGAAYVMSIPGEAPRLYKAVRSARSGFTYGVPAGCGHWTPWIRQAAPRERCRRCADKA